MDRIRIRTRSRRQAPQLEPLEGKQLLSGISAAALAARHAQVAAATAGAFSLAGTLKMPVSSVETFQISGTHFGTYTLSGKLGSTGQVSGRFYAVLDANNQYMSRGALQLSNKRGSLVLAMTSDAASSSTYDFKVTSGTGAFAGAAGSGTMATSVVSPNGKTMSFVMTMNPNPTA